MYVLRSRKTHELLKLLLFLLLAGMLITACQSAAPEEPEDMAEETTMEEEMPAEDEAITITWLNHWGDPEALAYWENVVAEFEAQNPNIKVEIINSGFDDLLTTFMTQFGTGSSPDVFHIKDDLLPDLVASGAILAPSEEHAGEIKNEWSQAGVDGMTWEGQVYGYPTEIGLRGFMYNEKILKEAGVEMPPFPQGYTFDEYAAMAKQVTENTDAKGAGFIIQYEASPRRKLHQFLME